MKERITPDKRREPIIIFTADCR